MCGVCGVLGEYDVRRLFLDLFDIYSISSVAYLNLIFGDLDSILEDDIAEEMLLLSL